MDHAITGNMAHLMVVMRAVKRFKHLLFQKRPELRESLLGSSHMVAPPRSIREIGSRALNKILVTEGSPTPPSGENDLDDMCGRMDGATVTSPVQITKNGGFEQRDELSETQAEPRDASPSRQPGHPQKQEQAPVRRQGVTFDEHAKGHAHDPLSDTLYLNIGPGNDDETPAEQEAPASEQYFVSESPPAVDMDIYETAYQDEMKRILERRQSASVYLTRRVEHREDIRNHTGILDAVKASSHDFIDKIRTSDSGFSDAVRSGSQDIKDKFARAKDSGVSDSVKASSRDFVDKISSSKGSGISSLVQAARVAKQSTGPGP